MVPKIIEIGLTSNCNLKCPLCTRNKIIFSKKDSFPKYRPNELDLNTLIEFIRYINPEEVKLVGAVGEPTLYKHFLELMLFLKQAEIKVWLSSNGSTHNPSWWKKLAEYIPDGSTINIDIDHTDKEAQKIYRRGSDLDSILSNVKALNMENRNFTIRAQRIIFDWNQDNQEEYFKIIPTLGFDSIYEIPCYDYRPEEFKEDVKFFTHPKLNEYKLFRLTGSTSLTSSKRDQVIECEAKKYKMIYLNYLGEVMPCCYINDEILKSKHRYINIYENSPVEILELYNKKINNPLSDDYSDVCNKFCNKLGKKFCKIFKLDP